MQRGLSVLQIKNWLQVLCVSLYCRKLAAYQQTGLCASEEIQLQIQREPFSFLILFPLHFDVKYFSGALSLFIMSV